MGDRFPRTPVNPKIRILLAQITALEDDLREALRDKESHLFYEIKGRRVEFTQSLRETHCKLTRGVLRWIVTDRPQNFVTGPLIYSLICPIKHAHRILGASARYERFLVYGDAPDYHARLEVFRAALADGSAGPKG